jgi:hypothetical protein
MKLEIGTELTAHKYGRVHGITKIDRVTEKMAFAGTTKFKRESLSDWIRPIGADTYGSYGYCLTTQEDREEITRSRRIEKLKDYKWDKLSDDSLRKIIEILNA